MTKTPPRLFVLMRPETERAVVLRQGPSKVFCTLGWDLRNDTLVVGQWCKHKIYVERCDISSDGKYLLYFALDGRWKSEARGAWTALSLAPYLNALKLWPQGDTWGGGGLFFRSREQLPSPRTANWDTLEQLENGDRMSHHGDAQLRLIRDGWTHVGKGHGTTKAIGAALTLQVKMVGPRGKYALVDRAGNVETRPGWTWADVDARRRRLLWASDGVIYAASIEANGIGATQQIFDARDMTFEAIAAPYNNTTVIVGAR